MVSLSLSDMDCCQWILANFAMPPVEGSKDAGFCGQGSRGLQWNRYGRQRRQYKQWRLESARTAKGAVDEGLRLRVARTQGRVDKGLTHTENDTTGPRTIVCGR